MSYNIIANPNHKGFQSLGSIKGVFQSADAKEPHKGTIATEHGTFTTIIHAKCRRRIISGKELYFLVWLRFVKKEPFLTVVGFGEEGIDNQFFISAALVSYKKVVGQKLLKYGLIAARNPEFLTEGKNKIKIKIFCKGELPKEHFKKFLAIESKFVEGELIIKTYKVISEEVPDSEFIFQKPPKKFGNKKRSNKTQTNNKVIKKKLEDKPVSKKEETPQNKALVRKKIPVGVIREAKPFDRPKKVVK